VFGLHQEITEIVTPLPDLEGSVRTALQVKPAIDRTNSVIRLDTPIRKGHPGYFPDISDKRHVYLLQ
jgi:hypothetical protein